MKQNMRACFHTQIVTPKKFVLNALWFGPRKPKKAIIFIHGLTGSAFSMMRMVDAMVDAQTAVVTFNNRGFEQIADVSRMVGTDKKYISIGAGHEVFADCTDDIQGAVDLVRGQGVKDVYLAGHSTGCQKAVYWASKNKKEKSVKGLVLFGPLSDYSAMKHQDNNGRLKKAVAHAVSLVRKGRPHELMPKELGPWFVCDAQRFLSLYTPDSVEEIFTYASPEKKPRALLSAGIPILTLLAGEDEHGDMPADKIAQWFSHNLPSPNRTTIIKGVTHGFKGGEKKAASAIRRFMRDTVQ